MSRLTGNRSTCTGKSVPSSPWWALAELTLPEMGPLPSQFIDRWFIRKGLKMALSETQLPV